MPPFDPARSRARPESADPRFAEPHFAGASRRPRPDGAREGRPRDYADERPAARHVARDADRAAGTHAAAAPRSGARRTLLHTIRQIPNYLRLLGGLLLDRRVALLDKALVAAAIAYVVSPLDFLPDVIPFLGQVDDVFLVVTALQRLVAQAGPHVVLDHWRGDPADLDDFSMQEVVTAATFFLPGRIKGKLVRLARRGR